MAGCQPVDGRVDRARSDPVSAGPHVEVDRAEVDVVGERAGSERKYELVSEGVQVRLRRRASLRSQVEQFGTVRAPMGTTIGRTGRP
jgi:hypothetical protein